MTLILTEFDKIIGGFTPLPWKTGGGEWEEDENGVKTTTREKVALGYEKCGDSFDFLDQETVSSSPIERPAGRC